jgi:hypothetical protein
MKRNWLMFFVMNVVGIAAGTMAAADVLFLLGYEINRNILITCAGLTAAISMFGSFAWWPDMWQKKS